MAPLPPGVVGSGVGAAAAAAGEAIRSSQPDPLLEAASQLVHELLHASRQHPFIDWCVGVFRTRAGVDTVIVSNEGAGYIPRGVFVPRSARMLFADRRLDAEFRARWFAWANPVETMLAYADFLAENGRGAELWAVAVSTDNGGSSAPARDAGVPHYEDCSVKSPAIKDDEPSMPLDEAHMHRLETLNPGLYARLVGLGDGRLPDRSEAWRTTLTAADTALGRAGALHDFVVPPLVRETLATLRDGVPVTPDRWTALTGAWLDALGASAALRPGLMPGGEAASPHVRAHHDLARLTEILQLWNLGAAADGPDIKYLEIAYLAAQISGVG